jgi:meso-butanediol dehydrogenase / (S,S)-butanediol dehydrogenase / diacetyl reductase
VNTARFAGKVAVVTGGTSGIGRATVERLHDEGAAVVFCGRRAELGAQIASDLATERIAFVVADVTVRDDLTQVYEAALNRFGQLDVVVNNAGNIVVSPTLQVEPRHWRRTIALNLDAVFDSCQLAISHLRATISSGRAAQAAIVNVASLNAVGADRGFAACSAAKAGVVNLTRALALEFGPEGIRVNAVSPGAVDTPLAAMSTADPTAASAYAAAIPLRRFGRAEEIAAAIAFLAADEASFVNGANLLVDGGVTAGTGHPDLLTIFGMS